jgi:hypothetical protein
MGKLFEKLILRTLQKHSDERNLLNASRFGFRADQSATLQCMRLMDPKGTFALPTHPIMECNTSSLEDLEFLKTYYKDIKGRDIPFVNDAMYLGVIFDRRMTWRHHTERTV